MAKTTVPHRIIDKNGRETTVYRTPEKGTPVQRRRGIFPILNKPVTMEVALITDDGTAIPYARPYDPDNAAQYIPSMFTYRGELMALAPDGYSGLLCPYCKQFLDDEAIAAYDGAVYTCLNCGDNAPEAGYIQTKDIDLFDASTVYERTWYHATTSDTDFTGDFLVHAGSEQAAIERTKALMNDRKDLDTQFRIYELRVKRNIPIAPAVIEDYEWQELRWPESESDLGRRGKNAYPGFKRGAVTRYINYYEDAGSISILAPQSAYEVKGERLVERSIIENVSLQPKTQVTAFTEEGMRDYLRQTNRLPAGFNEEKKRVKAEGF